MKIQGPNLMKLAAYRTQLQQKADVKKDINREDQLNISKEAKQLQESKKKSHQERAEYVQDIKNKVKSGQYEINYEKASQKMIDFWSERS